MGMGKEALHELEEIRAQQRRIFSDACDEGVLETDEIRTRIIAACKQLKDLEGMSVSQGEWGTQCKFRLGFEVDDGYINGVEISVAKLRCSTRNKKYFYNIEFKNTHWDVNAPKLS